MGLKQFERRLERLVEGAFAKAFRSGLQPVEVGRRLIREMDDQRTVGVRGVIAPNRFTVWLSDEDRKRFDGFEDALVRELADAARQHGRDEGYHFVGAVDVEVQTDPGLRAGELEVDAHIDDEGDGLVGSLVLADGARIRIGQEPVVIGRAPECEITVGDPQVSRRHAEVRRDFDGFRLVDLHSTNGTQVNGRRVTEHVLHDGDAITVGTTVLRFEAS